MHKKDLPKADRQADRRQADKQTGRIWNVLASTSGADTEASWGDVDSPLDPAFELLVRPQNLKGRFDIRIFSKGRFFHVKAYKTRVSVAVSNVRKCLAKTCAASRWPSYVNTPTTRLPSAFFHRVLFTPHDAL